MEIIYNSNIPLIDILKSSGTYVRNGKRFYFLPFWFEVKEDSEDELIAHKLGELPKDITDVIEDFKLIELIYKIKKV